ncbi:MAG TPA: hypothetical protein VLA37_01480 [Sphingomonadaceae bacterium]|nr:hypothetical protein [Sphingomonadaceae bacterium]
MNDDFYTRMQKKTEVQQMPARRLLLLAVVASFLLGAAVVAIVTWNWDLDPFGGAEERAASDSAAQSLSGPGTGSSDNAEVARTASAAANEAAVAVQAAEKVAEQQGGLDSRVAAMEQRLTQLDLQAQAAYSNASRAEGLLVAFAARRAIERGSPLGDFEEQLKVRFGDAYPNAVDAVIRAAERPVTVDKLRGSLDAMAPDLLDDPEQESGWEWFTREIGQLFIIRRESTPSPAPARRLERARIFLEAGQIQNAILEIEQMPGADRATQWLADAERYAAALRALDLIETSAIRSPENLRDVRDERFE